MYMTPTRNVTCYNGETVNREPLVIFCCKRNDHERGPSQTRSEKKNAYIFFLALELWKAIQGVSSIDVIRLWFTRSRVIGSKNRDIGRGRHAMVDVQCFLHARTLLLLGVDRQTGNCGLRPWSTVCRKEAESGWSGLPNTIVGCDIFSWYPCGVSMIREILIQ
jgi:hypothetical protein